ncbi:MAG TPA: hypothetical protein VM345_01060 [Acidimicrobiales bacterium]|jgi:hypothetical protein|nr:hypothetical protein [Acidimicrobiales bacterium]
MSDELVRDEELGAALRALPVPEHRSGFWDVALGESAARADRRQRPVALVLAVAAVVVVVACIVAIATGTRGGGDGTGVVAGPRGATAMLTGRLDGLQSDGARQHAFSQEFALAVDGSFSFVLTDGTGSQTYDASTRTWWISSQEGSGRGMGWLIRTNAEPQPPQLASLLGGLAVTVDRSAGESVVFLGRAAHRFVETGDLRSFGNRGEGDRVEAIVDDETGVMLRYEASLGGAVVARMEVVEIDSSTSIDRSRFTVRVPPTDAKIRPDSDDGVRIVDVDEVGEVVGYAVDAPARAGTYRLTSVAARPGMPGMSRPTPNPLDRDRVQLLYRDGWRAVEVVIRRTPSSPTTTMPAVVPEKTREIGGFTVTVRGDAADEVLADLLEEIRPAERVRR